MAMQPNKCGNGLSRRGFLRAGALAAATALMRRASAAERPPNVMIILSDDQGCVDLNCFGAKDLYTPNIDGLAARGVRFTQFYMGAPVCSPSRASLLTGRDCNSVGVPGNGRPLNEGETTIAEMLKASGYRTGIIGKWHVGKDPGPLGEGFEYFFGHLDGCIGNYDHFFYDWDKGVPRFHDLWRNKTEVFEKDTHFGELIVREVRGFLEEHQAEPFFLYVPFNNPHYPVQPLPQHLVRYAAMDEPRRSYAAFVSTLDEQVGKILAKLDALGLRENTLLIYMSDHGHSVESRNNLFLEEPGEYPGGGSSGPYRGHKGTLWEGGVRSPCIVSWPGHVPEGEVRGQVAMSYDWLPTIAAYTGTKLPELPLEGADIREVLASADAPTAHPVFHRYFRDHWFVRDGDWKLIGNAPISQYHGEILPGAERFLCNLAEDPGETTNLAEQHPAKVKRLEELHEAWAVARGFDPWPEPKQK